MEMSFLAKTSVNSWPRLTIPNKKGVKGLCQRSSLQPPVAQAKG
ncbi:hypothetical protein GFS31_05010 [Leptolyngbya sp. BL0902]|nr:hypothetical protein GFS31_05010 [Leptolyngbya sp. BL0902]